MATLRRAAALAVGVAVGAGLLAQPALAAPPQPAAVAGPVTVAKPNSLVPKDKTGNLVLYVDGQQAARGVAAVGGTVALSRNGRVEAKVPAGKVAELAKQPGVADIRQPDRVVPMGSIDPEGVLASTADQWIKAGFTGSGVKIGVIDPDLGGLADGQSAGTLPAQMPVNYGNCQADDPASTQHGRSVAEVVHATAPDAQLFVACAGTSMEFATAANWLQQQGVQVITAAIGMFTSGRGDGNGAADSPADVVRRTSQAGILWSVAAGNQAQTHWTGKATTNASRFVSFDGGSGVTDGFSAGVGQRLTIGLRWDAWPVTNQEFDLYVMKSSAPPTGPTDPNVVAYAANNQATTPGGGEPTAEVTFTVPNDPNQGPSHQYFVYLKNVNGNPATRLDLFMSGASGVFQYYTAAGSITEPATSPYALAVGATTPTSGQIEQYSAQGPTIDGRIKPDIAGYDNVSTSYNPNGTFGGTSAASAGVAGAAALVKSAGPGLDAAQVKAELVARTNPKRNDNQWGSGQLVLGPPPTQPITKGGSRYTALPKPLAIEGRDYQPNEVATLPIPNVPSDTTAVVFNLAVRTDPSVGPNVPSSLDVFTGDPTVSASRATTIRVTPTGGWVDVMVVARVGTDRAVRLRAGAGNVFDNVDLLGYFGANGSGYVSEQQPVRVLDTRGFNNSPRKTALGNGEVYSIPVRGVAGVPSTANAVLVNLTASESSVGTAMSLFATDNAGTTINVSANEKRSNTSIVPIAPDGTIKVRNGVGMVQATVDVIGSFTTDANAALFVPLPETTRVVDTATGTGERNGTIGQDETVNFQLGGLAGISSTATGVVLRAGGEEDSLGTSLSVFPQESGWLNDTNATMKQRERLAAAAFVPLGPSGRVGVRNEHGNAQVALDVAGYFVGGPAFNAGNTDCAAPVNEAGYTSVYDGRAESNLIGWRTLGAKGLTDDGCTMSTSDGSAPGASWYAARTLGESYTVKLDYKQDQEGLSSDVLIGFADPATDATSPLKTGVGVHIGLASASGQSMTGSVVPFSTAVAAAQKPAGQWNSYEISVDWRTITVRLNGTQVNQYSSDGSRFYGQYIGLANAAPGVHFRDIRVKRNQPIRVGQFVGANNRCLDLYNGSPNSTGTTNGISLWDCNTTGAQVWAQTADGALTNASKCLTALDNGTAAGTQEVLGSCVPQLSSQVWVIRDNGTIVNPRSGRCLTPASTANAAVLQLQDCTGRADQVWRVPDQHGQNGELTDPGGKCLDVDNGDPTRGIVQEWDCYHNQAQSWIAPGDGTLHAAGKCLTVNNAATTAGTGVVLWNCSAGDPGQQWVQRLDGTVLNPNAGRCLTGASDTNGGAFTIQDCTAAALQQWRMSAQTLWTGAIVGVGGKCTDIKAEDPANTTVWLWDCFGASGQQWTDQGDGRLLSLSNCIDIVSVNNGTAIGVTTCGSGSQQWAERPDGAIVNTYAGRVLDDQYGSTDNGTKMQIWDFVGTPQQRWAIPLRPS
ncbi:ricin-type beta-trefoil lectin domain protein [Kutzneria chonburiensis]|uniref:Ricin-type beta-trefoil lectin domain protein n=1 Tax=Kutzneria chonburiensis TaxID=1483604 RepID=A0ABV6MIZ5_9PSEU|nr:ricin-type beta-trefoil lectin domain protein [Kutzneria chonburiensis]